MSKWTGVTEFGEETKTNATRLRNLTRLPCLSGHPRLELVEMSVHDFRHAGIVFHHEQGEPGVRVVQIAYDVARSLQGTSRRTPLRNQQGLRRRIGDH